MSDDGDGRAGNELLRIGLPGYVGSSTHSRINVVGGSHQRKSRRGACGPDRGRTPARRRL